MEHMIKYKFWRNRTKQILDEAKQNFYNNMLKESKDPKIIWKCIHSLNPSNHIRPHNSGCLFLLTLFVIIGACLFSISLNKLYQIFKASLGSSTYSTFLNGAYDKSFKNSRSEQIIVKKDTHISIVYRNYKKIVESEFLKDLSYAPFKKVEYSFNMLL
jgi:hypothetical protein